MSARAVTVRAPAKINLYLSVGPVAPDGYHPLATVYQAVSLYDEVRAENPARAGSIDVTVTGEGRHHVPTGSSNLAIRAARRLAEVAGVSSGVHLRIAKRIAVAGGLAGGSTDAAGALVACDALWGTRADRDDLLAIAAELGSDVPFCLGGGTAVGSGRGTTLSPVLTRGSYEWVLGYATSGLSTAEVYAELDRMRGAPGVRAAPPRLPDELMTALRAGDPAALGAALGNDLQPAALRLRPALRRTLALSDDMGALGALVAGSGPTCVFLARDADAAADIAVELAGSGLCRSVQRASGPVPGARLVG